MFPAGEGVVCAWRGDAGPTTALPAPAGSGLGRRQRAASAPATASQGGRLAGGACAPRPATRRRPARPASRGRAARGALRPDRGSLLDSSARVRRGTWFRVPFAKDVRVESHSALLPPAGGRVRTTVAAAASCCTAVTLLHRWCARAPGTGIIREEARPGWPDDGYAQGAASQWGHAALKPTAGAARASREAASQPRCRLVALCCAAPCTAQLR